ncbi:M3 family oligoendopeptidase [Sporolactobacillus sp. THM19-2]|uniref:M3 family oligoendopeptidase n=1 Tax=Sporolactobacillus sp. THM19-2 TaxID=2511171 RepID=UPI0010201D9B|nr:M3 family oligoendopeptidase [Sporolactobacillus sp. THM19-2]RYL88899.1 M3 family oligoendopeptidase [Sporolactobacillus sp. THM19-2]
MEKLNQKWDLDPVFKGGSASPAFSGFLKQLQEDLRHFKSVLPHRIQVTANDADAFQTIVKQYGELAERLREAAAFTECLTSQNVKDEKALALSSRVQRLIALFEACDTQTDALLRRIDDKDWKKLVENLGDIRFALEEKRTLSRKKLPAEQEELISSLSVDGYHAWGQLYYALVGKIKIPLAHPAGGKETLSVSQASNLLDDPDRTVRQQVFHALENSWSENADLFAATLNHLSGYRLSVYEARGWSDFLAEPLAFNRMTRRTLDMMWQTVTEYKPKFVRFLERKAKLLGLDRLSWFDVHAPLTRDTKKVSYEDAAGFIVKHFRTFNPKMADFAKHALENRWIEAENRPDKRPGGFCTSFPLAGESRIFMTFSGTASNTSTIAHELGHAYHQSVMQDIPFLSQQYAMNVAETASTFSEMIVSDAAESAAKSKEEKLTFLSTKLERSIDLLMNIHARFLFETRFYAERKKGMVPADRLNQLMESAEKEAYLNTLDAYHPTFWASKLHFYITDWPFYNFPYTFGFLFSTGIYVQAFKEGKSFAAKYDALLRDTGRMTTEQLAEKHLGVDLSAPDFWRSALDYLAQDVDKFLALTDSP